MRTQQQHSNTKTVIEIIEIDKHIDHAIQINQASLKRHQIKVIRDYRETPVLLADKNLLLQILVNLITNARQAICEKNMDNGKITVTVEITPENTVSIIVQNNGGGMADENLDKIFQHGFTTKTSGNGFGLHSSANFCKLLHANLNVYSEGPDKGAEFHLELPLNDDELKQSATN